MAITLDTLDFLASDAGSRVLARLADENLDDDHTLRLIESLRRDLTPEQAGAALELARLRVKAREKFGDDAAVMFFTRDALEQASDPLVRQWRAAHSQTSEQVTDACCSIGADSIAFARAGADVIGFDIDPVRVAMARLNAAALGVPNARFEVADVRNGVPDADVIFFDPARRGENGRRIFDVERYEPPLSTVRGWNAGAILVKLSPGVDLAQLEDYGGSVTFVSVQGDLKEAVLTISEGDRCIRAVRLGDGDPAVWSRPSGDPTGAPISDPRGWLVEPDPAIIRAGLVSDLAAGINGALLDPEIAYITTDEQPDSAWVRAWQIRDWMPFNVKKLRAYLRDHQVGRVTVKKRGTAVTPETLIAKLKLNHSDSGSRTIVLTRCRGEHIMLVCADLQA